MITLHESDAHKNVMFHDMTEGTMVQANQHLIVSGGQGMLLDPGGHKVYTNLFARSAAVLPPSKLKYLFLSHQDPDIVAALNGWLMVTDADAYVSKIWTRFITHFGIDELAAKRIKPIPDEGMVLDLGGTPLKLLPAHYLHSPGNFQVYDPVAKILYSGDLGASVGHDSTSVKDFDAHLQYMEGFHRRYMPSTRALKLWVQMVRTLDIAIIAPQHGAIFDTPETVRRFIDWVDQLEVGADLLKEGFKVP